MYGRRVSMFLDSLFSPLGFAFLAATICAIGLLVIQSGVASLEMGREVAAKLRKIRVKSLLLIGISIFASYFVLLIITNSQQISFAISALAISIPFLINKYRAEKVIRERETAWPEVIDSLVSALQSGVSISDAVLALAEHSPSALRANFIRVKNAVHKGEGLESALKREKEELNSAISDQVFETLIVAKEFGGRDSNNALRLLSEFVRDDLDVLEEIRTKFGWIKNSAVLATVAPWILLVLLSSQRSTVEAFSTSSGIKILACGVLMTGLAYIWMERVGRIPITARALQ
jgi:tight adherence protein B